MKPETRQKIEQLFPLYPERRGALLPAIYLLQEEAGITFLFVTHDQEEALTLSDRVAVMQSGRILQMGPPREIYEAPTHRFVADFIGDINLLDGEALPGGGVRLDGGDARRPGARSRGRSGRCDRE